MIKAAVECVLEAVKEENEQKEKLIFDRIRKLEKQLEEKTKKVKELLAIKPATQSVSQATFAQILQDKSKESSATRNAIVNLAASEQEDRRQRESNVIITGLKATESNTQEAVLAYFEEAGLGHIKVRHVKRLRPKANSKTPDMFQVVLENQEQRNEALLQVKHRELPNFNGVFMREDRTPAQQAEFSKLNNERFRKNEELKQLELLDKPFRYIIHRWSGTVRCIDEPESSKFRKYIFKEPPHDVQAKIKQLRTRASTSPSTSEEHDYGLPATSKEPKKGQISAQTKPQRK